MSAAIVTCEVCEEELDWTPGYVLQHLGDETNYFHVLVFEEVGT